MCELIERYPAESLPKTGAVNATIVVRIDLDAFLGRLEKAGILDTGDRISPGMARKLACEAGIIPAVLGGNSEVLDLGRSRRLFSQAQRLALTLRDGGCAAEGCDRTHGLHAHHLQPWAHGGTTDLTNGLSLCHWHHMRAHDPTYEMTRGPTGTVGIHRRT